MKQSPGRLFLSCTQWSQSSLSLLLSLWTCRMLANGLWGKRGPHNFQNIDFKVQWHCFLFVSHWSLFGYFNILDLQSELEGHLFFLSPPGILTADLLIWQRLFYLLLLGLAHIISVAVSSNYLTLSLAVFNLLKNSLWVSSELYNSDVLSNFIGSILFLYSLINFPYNDQDFSLDSWAYLD